MPEPNVTQLVIDSMNRGFDKMDERFDRVEFTQAKQGERIAILETKQGERMTALETSLPDAAASAARKAVLAHIATKRKTWIGWGTAAGTFAAGALEVLHRFSGK